MALSVEADETALELFRRANRKPLKTGLAFFDEVSGEGGSARERGLGRGDVVELYGPSGCGKSEVLINVVVQCILPAWLGGEERTAFFFDNDGRLSIIRLEQLLKEKITTNTTFKVKTANASVRKATSDSGGVSGSQQLEDDVEEILVACLRRLRLVRPASLFELLASIEVLRFELEHRPAVVAVDGMGSFYWQDKMAQSCGGDAVSMQGAVVKALVRLVMEQPVVLFASKNALFVSRGTTAREAEHREYLPQAWQRAVTYRVVLQRRQERPRHLRSNTAGAGDGSTSSTSSSRGGSFSIFTARVSRLKALAGAGVMARGGIRGSSLNEESRAYYFVVTDDGIHDVPEAATLGEGRA